MSKKIFRAFIDSKIFGTSKFDVECDEVKVNLTDKITSDGTIDKAYENFKESMDQFLSQCEYDLKLECNTCKKEDRDGESFWVKNPS